MVGVLVCVNFFGVLVLEFYYVVLLVKEMKGVFGFNIIFGW